MFHYVFPNNNRRIEFMTNTPIGSPNTQIPGSEVSLGSLAFYSPLNQGIAPLVPGTAETAISASSIRSPEGFIRFKGVTLLENVGAHLFSPEPQEPQEPALAAKVVVAIASNEENTPPQSQYREEGMRTRQQTRIAAQKGINPPR
jgi:hypothetical protein